MSSRHAHTHTPDPFDDDRQRDPYGIIPEGFLEAYNATSIPEALRKAERAPSTSNPYEQPRCPSCGSTKVIVKPGHREIDHKQDTDYKCGGDCGAHFDDPAPSKLEAAKQRAAERRERPQTAAAFESSEQARLDEVGE